MRNVLTLLCIIVMVCVFAVPNAFAETYTLTIASSNPSSGVPITVSPNDRNGRGNGTTQFTRSYRDSTSITLTAPASTSGNTFQKWQRDGSDYSTNRTITFNLSRNRTMRAIYTTSTTAYTLTVASSNPSSGVAITVSPNDRNGQGNGTTQFTRSYNSGASVTLTAPAAAGSNAFQKWQRDGSDYSTNRTITVTLSQNRTLTAVYTTSTTAYTLTVASSNPATGVAITISPNDTIGQGSGTTQFTRSYTSGASVTLTAPATAGANTFQKWQRNGVDAATTQATTVAMTANTTMTAVYVGATTAELCKDGIDNDYDGLIDCADPDCATDASCTGAANSSHRGINAYNGPSTCLACHGTAMGTAVLNSVHGSWLGDTPNVPNITGSTGKWGQTNNYCTDPQMADYACLKCHVSLVAPVNAQGKVDMTKIKLTAADMDCLQCHQAKYFATFTPLDSTATPYTSCVDGSIHIYKRPLPDADGKIRKEMRLDLAPGETAVSLARTVHRPNNATCLLKCHAKAGGGDGTKRGDLASDMVNPPVTQDVHLSSAGTAQLTCTSCHAGTNHQIPGRGNDLPTEDTGAVMKKCVDCHAGMDGSTGHGTSTANRQAANRHVAKVDCTSCHIDRYAKGSIGTEISRDWTVPHWNPAGCEGQGAYNGEEVRGSNLIPEYRFWNKTSWVYDRNGTAGLMTDPIDGGLAMSYPLGDMTNGKLYPFKVHMSNNPIDITSGKTNFDVLQMFQTGCYDNAAVLALNYIGETGAYNWTANKAFQLITHGVAPKTTANDCTKCHSGTIDTSTVSKLDKLGYKTPKPTSDLCNDCHSSKTNNDFYWVHDKHVRGEGFNCSRCHSFSRP